MKLKQILFVAIVTIVSQSFSQVAPGKYYVQFTDKKNSPYSLSNPEEFLTQRAINRRANQGIDFDERDLPVNPQYLDGVAATGAQILFPTRWLNGTTVHTTDPAVIDAINALPYVANVRAIAKEKHSNNKPFFEKESAGPQNKPVNFKTGRETDAYNFGFAYDQIKLINIKLH